jgi:hypothetical protein
MVYKATPGLLIYAGRLMMKSAREVKLSLASVESAEDWIAQSARA